MGNNFTKIAAVTILLYNSDFIIEWNHMGCDGI